jgi:hypothetical protein
MEFAEQGFRRTLAVIEKKSARDRKRGRKFDHSSQSQTRQPLLSRSGSTGALTLSHQRDGGLKHCIWPVEPKRLKRQPGVGSIARRHPWPPANVRCTERASSGSSTSPPASPPPDRRRQRQGPGSYPPEPSVPKSPWNQCQPEWPSPSAGVQSLLLRGVTASPHRSFGSLCPTAGTISTLRSPIAGCPNRTPTRGKTPARSIVRSVGGVVD